MSNPENKMENVDKTVDKTMESRIATARKPQGKEGTETLERMNQSHESLTLWAMTFQPEKAEAVLDVGCGGGATLGRLLNQYPESKVFGIDYSPEGVALSRKNNEKELNTRCFVEEGSVWALPYDEGSFDLITAFETIYFWEDYEKSLNEIKRVLKKQGVFLVCCEMSDPTNPKWEEALPHMTLHTGETWKSLLESHGFTVRLEQGAGEWICLLCHVSAESIG